MQMIFSLIQLNDFLFSLKLFHVLFITCHKLSNYNN
jgi:hypothetical protein